MQIDETLISRLEHLARLELSKAESAHLRKDLNKILAMVEKLNEVDTTGVDPLIYINEEGNVWREDQVQNQVTPQQALDNAPDQDGVFFRVPKVIDLDKDHNNA